MEIPYRSSIAVSEGQRSSIVNPSVSPPTLVGTTNSSAPVTPTKPSSLSSAVSNALNRQRGRSQRAYPYEEMKWSLRRKSTKRERKPEEIPLNDNNSPNENPDDCRVTVV